MLFNKQTNKQMNKEKFLCLFFLCVQDYYGVTFPGTAATMPGRDGLANNPYSGKIAKSFTHHFWCFLFRILNANSCCFPKVTRYATSYLSLLSSSGLWKRWPRSRNIDLEIKLANSYSSIFCLGVFSSFFFLSSQQFLLFIHFFFFCSFKVRRQSLAGMTPRLQLPPPASQQLACSRSPSRLLRQEPRARDRDRTRPSRRRAKPF